MAAQRPFREMAISKIRAIVSGLWPQVPLLEGLHMTRERENEKLIELTCVCVVLWQAHVEVFGSYATGLCLPSSDIDIVVVGAPSGITGESTNIRRHSHSYCTQF